jgi:hypothetical protein
MAVKLVIFYGEYLYSASIFAGESLFRSSAPQKELGNHYVYPALPSSTIARIIAGTAGAKAPIPMGRISFPVASRKIKGIPCYSVSQEEEGWDQYFSQ